MSVHRCVYKRVDTLSIELDVHLPAHAQVESDPKDVLLYIHGGAFCAMDSTDVPKFVERWARRTSRILVSVNYRLAPQADLPTLFEDVKDALDWVTLTNANGEYGSLRSVLLERGSDILFSGNVAVIGGSAGGWLTLLAASLAHPSVKCVAAIYPMTNVSDEHYTVPWKMPSVVSKQSIQHYLDAPIVQGATPDFDYRTGAITGRHNVGIYMAQNALWRAWLLRDTPLEQYDVRLRVQKDWPPTFLLHGAEDVTILPSNSHDMAEAFRRARVPFEHVEVAGQAHFFDMLATEEQEDEFGLAALMHFVEHHLSSI